MPPLLGCRGSLKVQASVSLPTFLVEICVSGEKRDPARSRLYMGHSPAEPCSFFDCAFSSGSAASAIKRKECEIRMELICQTFGGPSIRCTIANGNTYEAKLSRRPDRSQLQHHHGN